VNEPIADCGIEENADRGLQNEKLAIQILNSEFLIPKLKL